MKTKVLKTKELRKLLEDTKVKVMPIPKAKAFLLAAYKRNFEFTAAQVSNGTSRICMYIAAKKLIDEHPRSKKMKSYFDSAQLLISWEDLRAIEKRKAAA